MIFWTIRTTFRQTLEKFLQYANSFIAQFRKSIRKIILSNKISFYSKCFHGHVECSCDNSAGKSFEWKTKKLVPCPKRMKKISGFFSEEDYFSSHFSNRHKECNFDNSVDKNLPDGRNFSAHYLKLINKAYFFRKKWFCQLDPLDKWSAVLTNLGKISTISQ